MYVAVTPTNSTNDRNAIYGERNRVRLRFEIVEIDLDRLNYGGVRGGLDVGPVYASSSSRLCDLFRARTVSLNETSTLMGINDSGGVRGSRSPRPRDDTLSG